MRTLEMRWLHRIGDTAEELKEDDIVLIKQVEERDVYIPLTLQHREVWTDKDGEFATKWQNVRIKKS